MSCKQTCHQIYKKSRVVADFGATGCFYGGSIGLLMTWTSMVVQPNSKMQHLTSRLGKTHLVFGVGSALALIGSMTVMRVAETMRDKVCSDD